MRRKKAFWTQKTHIFRCDEYICSVCGYHSDKPCPECPNCGSQMSGSQYDANWVDEMEKLDAMLDD